MNELQKYKLLLRISKKEYLIPITKEEYKELFDKKL